MALPKNGGVPAFPALKMGVYGLASMWLVLQLMAAASPRLSKATPTESPSASGIRATAQNVDELPELALNHPVRGEIGAGTSRLYRIHLDSGQYIHLALDAGSAKLELVLLSPSRVKVLQMRSRHIWPTAVSFIASATGLHAIEVRSLALDGRSGDYRLLVDKIRKASALDKQSVAAERALIEAEKWRQEWTAASFAKASNEYEKANRHLRIVDDPQELAYVLTRIADLYYTLGQNQKAFDYYQQVLPLVRRAGDPRLEVEALNALSGASIDVGKKESALAYGSQAQALSKAIHFVRGEAHALNNLGAYQSYLLGEKLSALELFNQSLNLWRPLGDEAGQAQTLMNIGYTHSDLGEIQKALSSFNQALQLWQKMADARGEALAVTAIGLGQSSLGEMQQALENHNKAAQLFKAIGDHIGQAITLNGMAYIYEVFGNNDKALELFNQALRLYRLSGRKSSEAVTLELIGELYAAQGDNQRALDYFKQNLAIVKTINNRRMEGYTLLGIGTVLDASGDQHNAVAYYRQSLAISESLHDRRGQAYALNSIGHLDERAGRRPEAMAAYRQAVALTRAVEDRAGEALTLHNMARVARDAGNLKEAYDQSRMLLNITEGLRTNVASQELRASYFASAHQHYELCVDILMQMHRRDPLSGYDAEALEVSERARGRSLLDLLQEGRVDIRQHADPVLLQRERELRQLLNAKAERQIALLSHNHTEEQAAAMKDEIADLNFAYEEALTQIRANSPHYAALTQPSNFRFSDLQQTLNEDVLLLEYMLGDERSYLWAVSSRSIASYELPGRAKIEAAAKAMYRCLTTFNRVPKREGAQSMRLYQQQQEVNYSQIAAELSQVLLAPAAPWLTKKRLLVVADGALQYVPFAALPEPVQARPGQSAAPPLILHHEIISLPSLSVLSVLRKEINGRREATKTLAILADPVYEKDDPRVNSTGAAGRNPSATRPGKNPDRPINPGLQTSRGQEDAEAGLRFQRLPFAWQEATMISRLVPAQERKLVLGFEANLATASSEELGQFRIIHFVTHGLIYGPYPQLYGIVLSLVDKDGHSQDGYLRLNEIYNLKLPVDLVVLSACQTALGKEIQGEGLIGLTRGFMYAGAARIVASLWNIDDRASSELMKLFYEFLLNQHMSPSTALQAAQVAMWKDPRWRFPYFWAGFVLQGEW
ncbi:MAG: CHAT domain-containing tetratricopeptide repeat protein [Blastocatellia bacterium]